MPTHASLTDPELHEPKGAASASANAVYRANGSGTGSWGKVGANNLDTASVLAFNKLLISVTMADIGTVNTIYVPIPLKGNVTNIIGAIQTAVAGSNTTITATNAVGTAMGTFSFDVASSTAGNTSSVSPASNNAFDPGQSLRITTDGAASNAVPCVFVVELTLTP